MEFFDELLKNASNQCLNEATGARQFIVGVNDKNDGVLIMNALKVIARLKVKSVVQVTGEDIVTPTSLVPKPTIYLKVVVGS